MTVDAETIREIVRKEILCALRDDPEVRRAVWLIAHSEFADTDDEQMHPTSRSETGHRSP